MIYNPKQEILVQQVIKALGDGSEEEILERLEHPPFDKVPTELREIPENILHRIIMRWEKKRVITSHVYEGKRLYCLMQIPWLARLDMIHVESVADEEAKKFLEELEKQAKEISAYASKAPMYGQYVTVEATFETVDPLLGGDMTDTLRELAFPRKFNGDLYIRPNWLIGYIRDNARLANLSNLSAYLRTSEGVFIEQPKPFRTSQIRVKEGHVTYEAIPPETKFKTIIQLPLSGYDGFDSVEAWQEKFFKKVEMAPLRGLGANSKVYGGRIKLVKMEKA
jgi:hypothetical protein